LKKSEEEQGHGGRCPDSWEDAYDLPEEASRKAIEDVDRREK